MHVIYKCLELPAFSVRMIHASCNSREWLDRIGVVARVNAHNLSVFAPSSHALSKTIVPPSSHFFLFLGEGEAPSYQKKQPISKDAQAQMCISMAQYEKRPELFYIDVQLSPR